MVASIASAQEVPAKYKSLLTTLAKTGDFKDNVFKVNIPRTSDRSATGVLANVFAVNPTGARYDAIINPGGESENAEWDGIWDAVVSRTPAGWTAEIWVPIQTLAFNPQCSAPRPADAGERSLGVTGAPVPGYSD
jgi:hypothetical protein